MTKIYSSFRKHWKPVIFSLSIIIFVIIVRLLLKDQIASFDNFIYKIVTHYKNNTITSIFKFITFLCSTWFILGVTCIIMISKYRKEGFYIGLNTLLCFLLNQSAKNIFSRNRPIDINLIIEKGYSFPSGHSMISLAFYGFLIYVIFHKRLSRRKKLLYSIPLVILTFLIGISRIYLGVHYASDVLAGFALSMAYLILFVKFIYKKV